MLLQIINDSIPKAKYQIIYFFVGCTYDDDSSNECTKAYETIDKKVIDDFHNRIKNAK